MKRFALGLFFCLVSAFAAAQYGQFPPGVFNNTAAMGGAVSSYTGPGDLGFASPAVWFGLRAYSSAKRGSAALNVCNAGDVSCADMFTDATTGNLVLATSGPNCGSVTCTIKSWYDQSGANSCSGACTTTQATEALRATLITNCVNTTLPCARFSQAAGTRYGTSGNNLAANINPPFSVTAVANRTGNTTNTADLLRLGATTGYPASINTAFMNNGGPDATATVSDNTWHSLQFVFGSPSNTSNINVDGTGNAVDTMGTGGFASGFPFQISQNALTADVVELGSWAVAFSGANATAMCHNQRLYWGTTGSC